LKRRDFIYLTGMGATAALMPGIPVIGKPIDPERMLETVDPALKKKMADVALNAARSKGATYTDVRIGRYLNSLLLPVKTKSRIL